VYFGSAPTNTTTVDGKELPEIGVSETINDEPNPKWTKVFSVQYTKGANQVNFLKIHCLSEDIFSFLLLLTFYFQKVYVEVRDHDPLNPDDVIGDAFFDMDEYVSKRGNVQQLLEKSKSGSVTMQKTTPFLFNLEVK